MSDFGSHGFQNGRERFVSLGHMTLLQVLGLRYTSLHTALSAWHSRTLRTRNDGRVEVTPRAVGASEGLALGTCDGAADGAELGAIEGDALGACGGDMLGATEGDSLGELLAVGDTGCSCSHLR